jgi:hypothetical protein
LRVFDRDSKLALQFVDLRLLFLDRFDQDGDYANMIE